MKLGGRKWEWIGVGGSGQDHGLEQPIKNQNSSTVYQRYWSVYKLMLLY